MTSFFDYALRLMRNDIVHQSKDVGMGLFVCHHYIPVHFWKMFYLLVCVIFFALQ